MKIERILTLFSGLRLKIYAEYNFWFCDVWETRVALVNYSAYILGVSGLWIYMENSKLLTVQVQ